MLEDAVALMRALWTAPGQPVSYTGQHIAVRDLVLSPAPARTGGPPIWLAGAGAPAERRVGRLADGWLPYLPSARGYAEGWKRVQEAAAIAGRPRPPVPALYLTVSLDESEPTATRRLRAKVASWYGRPFEMIRHEARSVGDAAGRRAGLEDCAQRCPRASSLRRQAVHFGILPVADDEPLLPVEHRQALRHVV